MGALEPTRGGVGFQEVLPAPSPLPSQGPYLSVNVKIPRLWHL